MRITQQFVRLATVVAVGALATLSLVVGSNSASAAQCVPGAYPVVQCQTAVLGRTVVRAGTNVAVFGTGYTPGAQVTATFCSSGQVLGSGTANSRGNVTVGVAIPSDTAPGQYAICLTGPNGGQAAATVTVVSASNARASGGLPLTASGGLPQTGSNLLAPLAGTGAGLVLIGAGLLFMVRRRRHSASA